jgi:signal transduction histidine kinase
LNHPDETNELGIAEFWVDGQAVLAEFDQLDANLIWQAGVAFGAGALLTLVGLGWAFRRLERSNRLLTNRTSELARANADLTLAAKTSAIGTVTSHLMHGLKNPLAGLESLVQAEGMSDSDEDRAAGLREAASAARRMRSIVDEVVAILSEEESGTRYELPISEVLELVSSRVIARADSRGVSFVHRGGERGSLSNREANLVSLILVNLIENAIEVSEAGQEVTLEALLYAREVEFLVEDDGPGLPEAVKANIFQPVRSNKEGGSGIGLALSHQLAVSLGGRLELEEDLSRKGTRFKLVIPIAVVSL